MMKKKTNPAKAVPKSSTGRPNAITANPFQAHMNPNETTATPMMISAITRKATRHPFMKSSLSNTLLLLHLRDPDYKVTLLTDHEVVFATTRADLNVACSILPHRQNVAFLNVCVSGVITPDAPIGGVDFNWDDLRLPSKHPHFAFS
jgi:hypothetical protein